MGTQNAKHNSTKNLYPVREFYNYHFVKSTIRDPGVTYILGMYIHPSLRKERLEP